jgi:alkylation response protein AidB-like acyl-CoA dehydrogenase
VPVSEAAKARCAMDYQEIAMDLQFTPRKRRFAPRCRLFSRRSCPSIFRQDQGRPAPEQGRSGRWHAILNERGWYANHWPQEHGGPGWGAVEKFIFDTECALAGGPRIVPFGVNMLGPVLIKYGNEQQKKYWLPRILSGQDWWCQGYSEPGAGSDLASVKTTAVRDGDFYIVNGQKTWTTQGQHANMIFCLVRTNREAKAQAGISFLLVDMNSPAWSCAPSARWTATRKSTKSSSPM